jgi:DNA polymerase III alpha subunit
MKVNEYGAVFLNVNELFDSLYENKLKDFKNIYLDQSVVDQFNTAKDLNRDKFDYLDKYIEPDTSLEQFDKNLQDNWFMPDEYKNMDIEEFLVEKCPEENYERLIDELTLFRQYNFIMVLKYLKYLVDTMRENNIVWGVGRGSSVASYCLYLLGVHKIDSIKYDLDIREFLK